MATQCPLPRYRRVRGITLQAARTTSLADRHVLLQSVAVTADHTAKRLTSANGESYESVWAPDLKQGASGVSRTSVVGSPGSDSTVGLGAAQRRLRRPTTSRRHEEAILKDIVELADQPTAGHLRRRDLRQRSELRTRASARRAPRLAPPRDRCGRPWWSMIGRCCSSSAWSH